MSATQIYEDQENVHTRASSKAVAAPTESLAARRPALGTVTNQPGQRRQPTRAVKHQAQKNSFAVYEDKENVKDDVKPVPVEPPKKVRNENRVQNNAMHDLATVMPVRSHGVPLENLNTDYESIGSPMLLDISCMDTTDSIMSPRRVSRLDAEDVLYCLSEYQDDIHNYIREAEMRFRPKANYMRKQTDISSQMRTILVDWLVEVGEEYKLHDETLHLAVSYIDRFLSQMSVLRGKLQLVGTACMYIASKYEEIYPPDVGEFVYITDDTYTKKQLLRMEHLIVKVLDFNLSVPTSNVFADFYCQQLRASDLIQSMTKYVMELTMLDSDQYLIYSHSVIAASALFLAAHILGGLSMDSIERVTRYRQVEVAACVKSMYATLKAAPNQTQQAVREKYKANQRRAVANIPVPDLC